MAEVFKYVNGRKITKVMAVQADVQAKLHAVADEHAAVAAAILGQHATGDPRHSSITVTHGRVDWFVNLDDTRGQSAAMSIEYGRGEESPYGPSEGVFALSDAFRFSR